MFLFVGGCASLQGKIGEVGTTYLQSFFDLKKNYAKKLNENIGSNKVSNISPILSAIYPIGKIINPKTQSAIAECNIIGKQVNKYQMAPLPAIEFKGYFSASVDLPYLWKEFISVESNAELKDLVELSYEELEQESIDEITLKQQIMKEECQMNLELIQKLTSYEEVSIIRGHIKGKEKIVSTNFVDDGIKVKVLKIGEFDVVYAKNGSFKIVDTAIKPRFFILSNLYLPSDTKLPLDLKTKLENQQFDDIFFSEMRIWLAQNVQFKAPIEYPENIETIAIESVPVLGVIIAVIVGILSLAIGGF
jgi:hypothetical protein